MIRTLLQVEQQRTAEVVLFNEEKRLRTLGNENLFAHEEKVTRTRPRLDVTTTFGCDVRGRSDNN